MAETCVPDGESDEWGIAKILIEGQSLQPVCGESKNYFLGLDMYSHKIYKWGMKKKLPIRKREEVIFLRVTPEEKATIDKNAQTHQLNVSEYMRYLLIIDGKNK